MACFKQLFSKLPKLVLLLLCIDLTKGDDHTILSFLEEPYNTGDNMTIQCIGQGFNIFQTNLHTFEINGVSYNLNPSSLPDGYGVSAGEASVSTNPWSIEYNITKQVLVESDNGTIYKCIIEGDANNLALIFQKGEVNRSETEVLPSHSFSQQTTSSEPYDSVSFSSSKNKGYFNYESTVTLKPSSTTSNVNEANSESTLIQNTTKNIVTVFNVNASTTSTKSSEFLNEVTTTLSLVSSVKYDETIVSSYTSTTSSKMYVASSSELGRMSKDEYNSAGSIFSASMTDAVPRISSTASYSQLATTAQELDPTNSPTASYSQSATTAQESAPSITSEGPVETSGTGHGVGNDPKKNESSEIVLIIVGSVTGIIGYLLTIVLIGLIMHLTIKAKRARRKRHTPTPPPPLPPMGNLPGLQRGNVMMCTNPVYCTIDHPDEPAPPYFKNEAEIIVHKDCRYQEFPEKKSQGEESLYDYVLP